MYATCTTAKCTRLHNSTISVHVKGRNDVSLTFWQPDQAQRHQICSQPKVLRRFPAKRDKVWWRGSCLNVPPIAKAGFGSAKIILGPCFITQVCLSLELFWTPALAQPIFSLSSCWLEVLNFVWATLTKVKIFTPFKRITVGGRPRLHQAAPQTHGTY